MKINAKGTKKTDKCCFPGVKIPFKANSVLLNAWLVKQHHVPLTCPMRSVHVIWTIQSDTSPVPPFTFSKNVNKRQRRQRLNAILIGSSCVCICVYLHITSVRWNSTQLPFRKSGGNVSKLLFRKVASNARSNVVPKCSTDNKIFEPISTIFCLSVKWKLNISCFIIVVMERSRGSSRGRGSFRGASTSHSRSFSNHHSSSSSSHQNDWHRSNGGSYNSGYDSRSLHNGAKRKYETSQHQDLRKMLHVNVTSNIYFTQL